MNIEGIDFKSEGPTLVGRHYCSFFLRVWKEKGLWIVSVARRKQVVIVTKPQRTRKGAVAVAKEAVTDLLVEEEIRAGAV